MAYKLQSLSFQEEQGRYVRVMSKERKRVQVELVDACTPSKASRGSRSGHSFVGLDDPLSPTLTDSKRIIIIPRFVDDYLVCKYLESIEESKSVSIIILG